MKNETCNSAGLPAEHRLIEYFERAALLDDEESLEKLQTKFESIGYRHLGEGARGIVFYKKGDYVVKLFRKDIGYIKFLELIKKYPGHINLPKILTFRRIKRGPFVNWYYTKIESLTPLPRIEYETQKDFHAFLFTLLAGKKNDLDRWYKLAHIEHIQAIKNIVAYVKRPTSKGGVGLRATLHQNLSTLIAQAEYWEESNENFAKILKVIYNHRTFSYGMDLHPGNIMKRGDDWVIIDPYVKEKPGDEIAYNGTLY